MLRPFRLLSFTWSFLPQEVSASFEECLSSAPSTLTVSVTVFGVLGNSPQYWENLSSETQTETAQWIAHSVLSTLEPRDSDEGKSEFVSLVAQAHSVELRSGTIDAYAIDVRPFHADAQRSFLRRTFFDIEFRGLSLCQSTYLAQKFCSAYFGADEELIYAVVRSLEKMKLYPREAMTIAASLNAGLQTLVRLSTEIQSDVEVDSPCAVTAVEEGSLFLLPNCPEHSLRCGEIEAEKISLCSPEEQNEQNTICKCSGGYEGLIDLSSDHKYDGNCTKQRGFCTGTGDMINMFVYEDPLGLDDKSDPAAPIRKVATGVIGEKATPACESTLRQDGTKAAFHPALQATCMSIDGVGQWVPERHCEMIPPIMPERPLCTDPVDLGMQDDVVRNCSNCLAEDEDCKCTIECGAKRRNTASLVKPGSRMCVDVEVQCPTELFPTWRPRGQRGQRCWYGDQPAGSDWCCEEAWGPTTPPLLLARVADCAALRTGQECLISQQGNTPCCWVHTGAEATQLLDNDGSRCFKGSQRLGSTSHTCAKGKPKLFTGQWNMGMLECKNMCTHDFDLLPLNLDVKGCDDCVPLQKDCECSIACKDPYIWFGGGVLGARFCINDFVWVGDDPGANGYPVCRKPVESPICTLPSTNSIDFHGCSYCKAGEESCKCSVKCRAGFRPFGRKNNEYERSQCVAKPLTLSSDIQCVDLNDEETCRSHHDSGKARRPCCWRKDFNSTQGYPCVEFGSLELTTDETTPQCAPVTAGVFDNIPDCRPTCNVSRLLSMPYIRFSDACSNCFVGRTEPCSCTLQCAPGTQYDGSSSRTPGEPPWHDVSCEDDGHFAEVPVCFPPLDLGVSPCSIPRDDSLKVSGCDNCIPGSDSACDCVVECADDCLFIPSDPDRVEGKRTCREDLFHCPRRTIWEQATKRCKDVFTGVHTRDQCCTEFHFSEPPDLQRVSSCVGLSEKQCLLSRENTNEKACCWLSDDQLSGICEVAESDRITDRLPIVACADRPPVRIGVWREPMPQCEKKCVHDFDTGTHLKSYSVGCDNCVPGNCSCEVYCADGYIQIGGGLEGERSCGSDGHLQEAPLCAQARIPLCEPPSTDNYISTGCSNCLAGDEDCACEVRCPDGFRSTSPVSLLLTHTCKYVDTLMNLQPVDRCEDADKENGGCGAQRQLTHGKWQPCCWRSEGFRQSGSPKCVILGSPMISGASLPSSCALTSKAVWDPPLPQCVKTCSVPRQTASLNIVGCEDCIPMQSVRCDCVVRCAQGYRKRSGKEGTQHCVARSDRRLEFRDLPVCEAVCNTPDQNGGLLDVSGCLDDCFLGDDKCCRLKCAEGAVAAGGSEGFARCAVTTFGLGYTNIPICQPVCKAVDDQFKSRKVNGCGECTAGADCVCRITCHGKRSGGGQEGMYTCVSFPATDKESFVSARWVWHDSTTWGRPLRDRIGLTSWDELPFCMAPVQVLLLDAITKKALPGISVAADDRHYGSLPVHISDVNGLVVLMTGAAKITITAWAEGFATNHRTFDRVEQCAMDPANCKLQLAMSRKISGAALQPDGCYFAFGHGDYKWTMRAVLSWTNAFNSDVDIKARSWDCAMDVAKRYACLDTESLCRRSAFMDEKVRLSEGKACTAYDGLVKDSTWILAFPAVPGANVSLNSSLIESDFATTYGFENARLLLTGTLVRIRQEIHEMASVMAAAQRQSEWNNPSVRDKVLPFRGQVAKVLQIKGIGLWRKSYNAVLELADGKIIEFPIELLTISSQPLVGLLSKNQYSKWVDFNRRIVTNLHKRIDENGKVRPARDAKEWTIDNHIVLDVDERRKAGPETITFHNVPPGRYQIYAHLYDSESLRQRGKSNLDIKNTMPHVSLYIAGSGGNEVQFDCAIKPACKISSRIWQVMDVIVEARGKEFRRMTSHDEARHFVTGNYTMVIRSFQFGVNNIRKGDVGQILAKMSNGDMRIQFDKIEQALLVPLTEVDNLEVVYPTERDAYGVKLVYGKGMAPMAQHSFPTWNAAMTSQLFSGEKKYFVPCQEGTHDRTSYSDRYLRLNCASECVPARGSESYASCIDSSM